jgi:DNA mismatch repair protein MutL
MNPAPPKIDLLPEHLIDQIKAGEVIERPGNLIKEILENAVDAGATKIELTLKNNGLDLISLKDNGHGMYFKDLPLAFSRHATSKINRFEDLYRLTSYGFRGEALASIAAISRLQCITFNSSEEAGAEIRIEGGETLFHGKRQKISSHSGTELVIQDLFFNTPVRLKFIQSQQSEKQFIKRVVYAFILARPEIEFQLKIDESEKEIFPAYPDLRRRLEDLVPKGKDQLLYAEKFYENNELELFLLPSHLKTPIKFQNVFINDRYILDKQFHRVLSNALHSSLGHDDFHYLAFFQLPPDCIDVNVHPNKTIIKILENSKLISLLTSTVKELASGSVKRSAPSSDHPVFNSSPSLPQMFEESSELLQRRHDYNMEGHFSPHNLPLDTQDNFLWINNFFLKQQESRWWAVSAPRLLACYIENRLTQPAPTIPLLVSEPYPIKNAKPAAVERLNRAGVDLESLGKETLVLRSIPEWMNGFPLREIFSSLIAGEDITKININPHDWSQSTWNEMLNHFSPGYLIENKIMLDLQTVLSENLK